METTLDSDGKPSVASSRPPYWCSICSLDLQSNKSLMQHSKGRKHWKRLTEQMLLPDEYNPSSQTPRGTHCYVCGEVFETRAQREQHFVADHVDATQHIQGEQTFFFRCDVCKENFSTYLAYERHRNENLDARHLKDLYQKQGIEFDENTLKAACVLQAATDMKRHEGDVESSHMNEFDENALDEICAVPATAPEMKRNDHDVDFSQMGDVGRMLQFEYDDTVVELALHNYESFYSLEPGSATFTEVNGTSAGIQGWSTLGDVAPPENTKAIGLAAQKNTNVSSHKGDNEEEDLLRMAIMESLLESRGVHPAGRQEEREADTSKCKGDIEESSYQYESENETNYKYESQSETSLSQSDDESWSNTSDSQEQKKSDTELNEINCSFSHGDEWNIVTSDALTERFGF